MKSSFSNPSGNCVDVTETLDGVEVRDTKLGDASPVHRYTAEEWDAFIAGVKAGEFDRRLGDAVKPRAWS